MHGEGGWARVVTVGVDRVMVPRTLIGVGAVLCTVFAAAPCGAQAEPEKQDSLRPLVKVETTLGEFVLELDAHQAPVTVLNFVRYAEDGFYEGTIFHRVKSDFLIQGGGFTSDMKRKREGLRGRIRNEWTNGLKNEAGTIAMARKLREPHSATSQFFINVVDNPALDRPLGGAGYCVFGKVVEGMETIEKIRNTPVATDPNYKRGDEAVVPVEPVVIKSVRLISEFDRSKSEAAIKMLQEIHAKARAEEAARKEAFVKWLADIKAKATPTESGLLYYDQTVGDGASPEPTNKVRVHHTMWLVDGTIVEDSRREGDSVEYWLDRMVKGWTEGVVSMKIGGRRILIVPPELGFGDLRRPKVPPDSTLVYDVELFEIVE
jgi:cyclophilin family peptidyl-prolyl cis-trans isomerase